MYMAECPFFFVLYSRLLRSVVHVVSTGYQLSNEAGGGDHRLRGKLPKSSRPLLHASAPSPFPTIY